MRPTRQPRNAKVTQCDAYIRTRLRQQPNNAGGSLPNVGPMGTGLNRPFQVPPGQPNPPQQAPPAAAGFDRRVPFPRAGLEATFGPQGPGGPMGPHIPPELLARHVAFLKAAAARARAMQEAAADGEDNPQPSSFRERGQPRPAIDGGRPVDFPKAIPPFHRPQGIPTRQGGNMVSLCAARTEVHKAACTTQIPETIFFYSSDDTSMQPTSSRPTVYCANSVNVK
ncbi:hypothetical protein HPB51_019783 [Rhipicephalus microplus]|uniref:Uncharacterized protein n=1 Tax=Rhipicephalus microplus TaxID=6941 RepID=A0A9J6E2V4_RHIMP|nr:hypothetical protein HPB51_019783 [Rhipicephalus microplus]